MKLPGRSGAKPLRRQAVGLLFGFCKLACIDDRLADDPPWPNDAWVVVVVTGGDGSLLDVEPRVLPPGDPLEVPLAQDLQVFAQAFPAEGAGGPRLRSCGARFGGPGVPLYGALGSWSTPLVPVDQPERFQLQPIGAEQLGPFLLREGCDDSPCARLEYQAFPAPVLDRQLEQVAAIDDSRVMVSSDLNDDLGGFELWRVEGEVWRSVPPVPPLDQPLVDLDLDPLRGLVVGVDEARRRIEVDPTNGRVVNVVTGTIGREYNHFGAGRWVRFGETGLEVERGPALPPFAGPVHALTFTPAGQTAFTSPQGVYWDQAGDGFRLERAAEAGEEWGPITTDGTTVIAGGLLGQFLVRSLDQPRWISRTSPFDRERIRGLAPLGQGRFLVIGDLGLLGIFDANLGPAGSCLVSPKPTIAHIFDLSVAPSGRVAYAVTNEIRSRSGDAPLLLRIVLP